MRCEVVQALAHVLTIEVAQAGESEARKAWKAGRSTSERGMSGDRVCHRRARSLGMESG